MTDAEFDARIASLELRAKRVLQSLVTMAGTVALTALGLLAAWHQITDTKATVAQVDAHVQVNDSRLDRADAPPPDPVVAAKAEALIGGSTK